MKRKKTLLLLALPIFIYILWLFYQLLSFKTYSTPAKNSPLEIEGVFHVHSNISDGHKNPEEIAEIASRTSLKFIILTDHGNPNYKYLQSQGYKSGILVLAGSEVSVNRGHMVALSFDAPSSAFSQVAERAARKIEILGGFSIIAHPFSKVSWTWGKFSPYRGLEIINGDSFLKKKFFSSLPYLPLVLVKPEYSLIKMMDSPEKNLKKWDELNRDFHPIYGVFSVDAHLLYRPLFSLLHLHLLLKDPLSKDFEKAKNQVFETLRKGRFYNAVDAAAEARGFRFWAKKENKTIQMGGTLPLNAPIILHIKAPFPFAAETNLVHNGKPVLRSRKRRISYEAEQTGTYRVEVYLKEKTPLEKNVPWIVSNPIFITEDSE